MSVQTGPLSFRTAQTRQGNQCTQPENNLPNIHTPYCFPSKRFLNLFARAEIVAGLSRVPQFCLFYLQLLVLSRPCDDFNNNSHTDWTTNLLAPLYPVLTLSKLSNLPVAIHSIIYLLTDICIEDAHTIRGKRKIKPLLYISIYISRLKLGFHR